MLLVALTACFWHSYGRAAATHADLLVAMARKGRDLVVNGRFSAESMPELTYPLERAEAFSHAALLRSGSDVPASVAAFQDLLAAYRGFVDTLDRVRRTDTGTAAESVLAEPLRKVEASRDAVHAALQAEGRL